MSKPPLPTRQPSHHTRPYILPPHPLESLLRVDFIPFTQRRQAARQSTQPLPLLSKPTTSNSQKSLQSRHTNASEQKPFKIKVKKQWPKSEPKKKEFAKEEIRGQNQSVGQTETREIQAGREESLERKEQVHNVGENYVEKKMGIGKKKNNKTLKQFVMETLSKAKAESNCLVLHKGTMQQAAPLPPLPAHHPSPNPTKTKSPPKQQQQPPRPNHPNTNNLKSIFGQLKRSNQTDRHTRLPPTATTDNKKWVQMARDFEQKHAPALEIPEQIEEIVEIDQSEAEDKLRNESIKQQIMVEESASPLPTRK